MKSLTFFRQSRLPSEAIDVDVTPVMNVFIILIPFLVSMAVFTHLSILEFSVPPNVGSGTSSNEEKPRLKLTVIVAPHYLSIAKGETLLDSFPVINKEYQFDSLKMRLQSRRGETDIQDEIVVASRDDIRFKHVVKIMDLCREVGFTKTGLSSATSEPETGR